MSLKTSLLSVVSINGADKLTCSGSRTPSSDLRELCTSTFGEADLIVEAWSSAIRAITSSRDARSLGEGSHSRYTKLGQFPSTCGICLLRPEWSAGSSLVLDLTVLA